MEFESDYDSDEIEENLECEEDYFAQSIGSMSNENDLDEIREKMNLMPFQYKKPSQGKLLEAKKYEIIGFLGNGVLGKVFRAIDKLKNRVVALKIIEKQKLRKENKIDDPFIESKILTELDHPNIVKCYDTFEDNKKIYTVLEYGSGGNLQDFIKLNHPIPLETIQFFTAKLINALEYLHIKGIVHRDLKPLNIILDSNLELKIIDFFTCKVINRYFNFEDSYFKGDQSDEDELKVDETNFETETSLIGTPDYLSPEVLFNNQTSPESDLWSLGIILFQLATGFTPFKDKTQYLVFKNILNSSIDYPEYINSDLKDLISNLLMLDPAKRIGAKLNYFELKNHQFLHNIKFNDIYEKEVPFKSFLKIKLNIEHNDLKENKNDEIPSNEEEITKEGILRRSNKNKRIKLLLYSSGILNYIDYKKNILKKQFNLFEDCEVFCFDEKQLEIRTKIKTYSLICENEDAVEWVRIINQIQIR